MNCPHCNTVVKLEWQESGIFGSAQSFEQGHRVAHAACPACEGLVVMLRTGALRSSLEGKQLTVESEELLFPKAAPRPVPPEVPSEIKADYIEAFALLSVSPKASAALSRRLLKRIMQSRYGIVNESLIRAMELLKERHVPSLVKEAVDAVRTIGNYAANPHKDTRPNEIADVEPGEAEWMLEVLDLLFEFTYVQPARYAARKSDLNRKLASLGKPELK